MDEWVTSGFRYHGGGIKVTSSLLQTFDKVVVQSKQAKHRVRPTLYTTGPLGVKVRPLPPGLWRAA
eukprot:2890485-Pyramimonas_sp.AAC.1